MMKHVKIMRIKPERYWHFVVFGPEAEVICYPLYNRLETFVFISLQDKYRILPYIRVCCFLLLFHLAYRLWWIRLLHVDIIEIQIVMIGYHFVREEYIAFLYRVDRKVLLFSTFVGGLKH